MILHKDLLGTDQLERYEIEEIVRRAQSLLPLAQGEAPQRTCLSGKTMLTLFYEPSTRTRVSFELAALRMGANVVNLPVAQSSVCKGESLIDTAQTLDAMAPDFIVVRHPLSGASSLLARHTHASVINAGDGCHQHPTQALLDLVALLEHLGSVAGKTILIVGDIAHSRVARSNIHLLKKMGAKVRLCAPPTLMPKAIEVMGVEVSNHIDEAIVGVHAVMALRMQKERQQAGLLPSLGEYARLFGINERRMELAHPDAPLLHPGPVNRGVEVTPEMADHRRSLILRQVTCGLAVRMAVMELLAERRALQCAC